MDAAQNSSVMITGGRGFIGRAVGKLLQCSGYHVVSLDQSTTPDCQPHHEKPGEVQCDISDAGQVQRLFEAGRIYGIVHLAAVLPTAAQREPVRATQVNIEASLNLLEMARSFGVRRVVFASSLSVYGTCAPDRIVSEASPAAPEDLYGAAKLYVEQLGAAYRERHGLGFVSLRIGRVVGPGAQSATSAWRSLIFEQLGTKHPTEIALPYVGEERVLLVHVDDVAKMLVTLLHVPRLEHAIYNAPSESMVVSELKRAVESLNPNIVIRLGAECAKGNPRRLDSNRFQQEFGFRPVTIAEELRKAAGQ